MERCNRDRRDGEDEQAGDKVWSEAFQLVRQFPGPMFNRIRRRLRVSGEAPNRE